MTMQLLWILLSTLLVSVVSLVGALTLSVKERLLKAILFLLVAFSAGAPFWRGLPAPYPRGHRDRRPAGRLHLCDRRICLIFLLEKYLYWRHCHDGVCHQHTFTYLNLFGDGLHNFIDGLVIAGSFAVSVRLGLFTTLLVIIHEIPQELGDFGVLVYGGFSRQKALFYNFLSGLCAFGGAILGYFLSHKIEGFSYILLALTAGGFIYISSADLVPEIHKETDTRKSALSLAFFIFGIVLMLVLKKFA